MISILILTYEQPTALELCLESIVKNQYHKNQILIVENGYCEANKPIFEKYKEGKDFITKERRQPIITNTVFGEQEHFGIKNAPPCRFYPSLRAQILGNYEDCMKLTIPYRTMEFPTYGEQMLWPYSTDLDRVFISDRKHKENMELIVRWNTVGFGVGGLASGSGIGQIKL